MTAQYTVFRAKDGAVIDLEGLKALGNEASRYLDAVMAQLAPDLTGVIVEGLEPNGKLPKKKSVPGIMSFQPSSFSISAGTAILRDDAGAWQLVHINETLMVENDEPDKSDALRVLVLELKRDKGVDPDGDRCAYDILTPAVRFQRQGQPLLAHQLPIARELAPKIWTVDVSRLLQPSHPALASIFAEFDELEDVIWNADRHGPFWDNFRLGREWQTYQTKASTAVTAARMALSFRPSTSKDRARVLTNLQWQLQRSVDDAARHLRDWIGIAEAAGVYEAMFSSYPESWDAMD